MQMTDEVRAALDVLKKAAENDFERLAIERMETALTNPPQVKVIDERRQEFDGKIYFRGQNGYYFTNYHLHVVVWEMYHGKIPKGFHVHHGAGGVDCNEPSNLSLKSQSEHAKLHFQREWDKLKEQRRVCKNCGEEFAPVQHNQVFCGKSCQIQYYSRHRKKHFVKRTCPVCGKEFETVDKGRFTTQTCSWECSGKLARQKSPVTNRERDESGKFK